MPYQGQVNFQQAKNRLNKGGMLSQVGGSPTPIGPPVGFGGPGFGPQTGGMTGANGIGGQPGLGGARQGGAVTNGPFNNGRFVGPGAKPPQTQFGSVAGADNGGAVFGQGK